MKITGLITEYNPFHNGHLYHIKKSREITGAGYCIVLMSGSFVQRGAPAIYDKYVRTSMALSAGADLVIEMPVSFSTASAMEFAAYGVSLFTALGCVDSICFGSESGDISQLTKIAALLADEPQQLSRTLRSSLKKGMTYPQARKEALLSFLSPEEQEILNSPNNILGIEYIKAGMTLQSPLRFYTIQRKGQAYHDITAIHGTRDAASHPASASAIRHLLESENFFEQNRSGVLAAMVPDHVYQMMQQEIPIFTNDFSTLLNYRILKGDWNNISDLTPELDARIRKSAVFPATFEEQIQTLKTRHLTYTRVSRVLLHLLLDLNEDDIRLYKRNGYALYSRILGFRKTAQPLLNHIKHSASIPLITKLADAWKNLTPQALSMLEQEIQAAHIYQMIRQTKGGAFKNEYTQGILLCDTMAEFLQ